MVQNFRLVVLFSFLRGSTGETECNSYPCPSTGKVFSPLDFSLIYYNWKVICLGVVFGTCSVFWVSWICSLVFGQILSHLLFSNVSLISVSFWYSHYVRIMPSVVSHGPWIFCFSFCSPCFSVWEASIEISLSLEMLSSTVSGLTSRLRYLFLSQRFWCPAFLFGPFFGFLSLCSYCPSLLTCYFIHWNT